MVARSLFALRGRVCDDRQPIWNPPDLSDLPVPLYEHWGWIIHGLETWETASGDRCSLRPELWECHAVRRATFFFLYQLYRWTPHAGTSSLSGMQRGLGTGTAILGRLSSATAGGWHLSLILRRRGSACLRHSL